MRRRGSLVVAVIMAAVIAISGTTPASAFTSLEALKNPANAWLVADLAGTSVDIAGSAAPDLAVITDPNGQLDSVLYSSTTATTSGSAILAGRAVPTTVSRSASTTIVPKRRVPGRVGMILNTAAVMLGIGGMFLQGDNEVEYVGPTAPPTSSGNNPSILTTSVPTGGFWSGQFQYQRADVLLETINNTQVRMSVTWPAFPAGLPANNAPRFSLGTTPAPTCTYTTGETASGSGINGTFSPYDAGGGVYILETSCGGAGGPTASRTGMNLIGQHCCGLPNQVNEPLGTLYFANSPDRPAPTNVSPIPVPVTSEVECINAAGVSTIVKSTQDIILAPGQGWNPPSVACPDGSVAGSGETYGIWPDGSKVQMVPKVNASPEVRNLPGLGADTTGNVAPDLQVNINPDPQGQPQWRTCIQMPSFCERDLRTETDAPTLARYRCMSGAVVISLNLCKPQGVNPQTGEPIVRLPAPTPDPNAAPPTPVDNNCPPQVSFISFITGRLIYDAVVCSAKFLFVPKSMEAWKTDALSISAKPPVSFFVTARAFWDELGVTTGCIQTSSCPDRSFIMGDAMGIVEIAPFQYVVERADEQWMIRLRQLGIFATWAAVVWWTVNRISASFGGKSEA